MTHLTLALSSVVITHLLCHPLGGTRARTTINTREQAHRACLSLHLLTGEALVWPLTCALEPNEGGVRGAGAIILARIGVTGVRTLALHKPEAISTLAGVAEPAFLALAVLRTLDGLTAALTSTPITGIDSGDDVDL